MKTHFEKEPHFENESSFGNWNVENYGKIQKKLAKSSSQDAVAATLVFS